MKSFLSRVLSIAMMALAGAPYAYAAPISILFVGNSYTFGRVDPVMSYNAANVHDLTASMYAANSTGANAFEPHPWGGVAGIFKQFTVEAHLDYDVSMSARNATSSPAQIQPTSRQHVSPPACRRAPAAWCATSPPMPTATLRPIFTSTKRGRGPTW